MSDFKGYSVEEREFNTVFAEDFEFEGFADFKDPVLIKGKINGEIKSSSSVYLGKTSFLDVNADCDVLSIKGNIKGEIKINTRIELLDGSCVIANIESKDMIMQSGSKLIGNCKIGNFEEENNNNEETTN